MPEGIENKAAVTPLSPRPARFATRSGRVSPYPVAFARSRGRKGRVNFYILYPVRVVADDNICAGIYGGMGKINLLRVWAAGIFNAGVHGDNYDVCAAIFY